MKKIILLMFLFTAYLSNGQVKSYTFAQSVGTYTEITEGQLLGSETSDEQRFLNENFPDGSNVFTGEGIEIGFDFVYNGLVYDRFGVHTNGWICLGSSTSTPGVDITTSSSSMPLSSVAPSVPDFLGSRISALGKNLQAQIGSTLRYQTIGVAPNRTLVVQWKNYRRQGSIGGDDIFSFQIRLNETTNVIEFVYDNFTSSVTAEANYQVGLRVAPQATATNYVNRTTTASWEETTAGTMATSSMSLSNTIKPTNGLTYTWTPPVCSAPINGFFVSNLSNDSATLNWNPSISVPINYEYIVSISSELPVVAGTEEATTSVAVSDLLSNTNYFVFLRSICDTENSIWVLAGSFRTQCEPITDLYENFDTYTLSTGFLPNCWSRGGSGGNTASVVGSSVEPSSVPNRLSFYTVGGTSPTEAFVILPPVSNLQAETHRLRFKAFTTAADKFLDVGYLTDPADMNTFVLLESVLLPVNAINAEDFSIVPTDVPVGVKNLAFKHSGVDQSSVTYLNIDDVNWEFNSPCEIPTGLIASDINSNDVTLSWYAGASENEWEIEYGAPNFALGTGTTVSGIAALEVNVDNLLPNTTYQVYLRAICSEDVPSSWTNSITFKTKCASVTEFSENFDSYPTFTMPTCWSKSGTSTSVNIVNGSMSPSSVPNRLSMSASGSSSFPTVAYAILPDVSNLQDNTHRLTFKAYATASDRFVHIGYFTDLTNTSTYVNIQTIALPSFLASSALEFMIDPEDIPDGVKNLVFKNDGAPNTTNLFYIDDVSWTAKPSCLDLFDLEYSAITSTNATIEWSTNGSESEWQYVYTSDLNADPNTLLINDVSDLATATLINLDPSTTYKVLVRSKCGTNLFGAWSVSTVFSTNCSAVTDFYEDFNAGSTLPECWKKVENGGNAYILTGGTAPNNQNILSLVSTSSSGVVVALPPVSNASSGTHQLKFKAVSGSGTTFGTIEVGYLEDSTSADSFTSIQSFIVDSSTTYTTFTALLGTDPTTENIAIRLTPSTPSNVLIEDVAWEPIPTTVPNCATVNALTSTACGNYENVLSWTPVSGADGYTITVGTTPNGTGVVNNQELETALSYAFFGDISTTYYYTVKPYNSFGTATGCAEQSFTTMETPCYCLAQPNSNDGNGITNILLGTTNFANGDVYYFDHSASSVTVNKTVSTNLQLTFATPGYDYNTNVWIDYNDNFEFEPSELVFFGVAGITSPSVLNASFIVPADVALGNHKMRIVATDVLQNPANPCYSGSYGIVLDFTINVQNNLSNEDFDKSVFRVYPNPVKDNVHFSNTAIIKEVALFNLLGQQVILQKINATEGQLNLSSVSSGTYLLKLTTDSAIKTIKIIKQ